MPAVNQTRKSRERRHGPSKVSFADLSKRIDQPDPLEVEVAPDVWVTFLDPFDGDYDQELDMPDEPRKQLQLLLGDEAFAEFEAKDVNLSARAYVALANMVMEHFRLGEDAALPR